LLPGKIWPPKLKVKERKAFPFPSKEKVPAADKWKKSANALWLPFEGAAHQTIEREPVGPGYCRNCASGVSLHNILFPCQKHCQRDNDEQGGSKALDGVEVTNLSAGIARHCRRRSISATASSDTLGGGASAISRHYVVPTGQAMRRDRVTSGARRRPIATPNPPARSTRSPAPCHRAAGTPCGDSRARSA